MAEFSKLNGYDVKDKKAIRTYDTVALMKADTTLKEGQTVQTLGYYSINDNGNAEYLIVDDNLTEDGGSIHELNNGLFAKLIVNNEINVKQLGAVGNGIIDDTNKIQLACDLYNNIYIPEGTYLITSTINIDKYPISIYGDNDNTIIKINSEIYGFSLTHGKGNIIKDLKFNIESGGAITVNPNEVENNINLDKITIENENTDYNIIYMSNLHHVFLNNIEMKGTNTSNGIKLDNIANCFISKSSISNYQYGIYVTCSNNLTSEGIHINDCLLYENLYQIYTDNTKAILDFNISNNIFDYCKTEGLHIINSENLKILGNYFGIDDNSCIGINLQATTNGRTNVNISNNNFQNYKTAPINPTIKINNSESTYNYNDIKITNNSVTIYKIFTEIYSSSGILSGNTITSGVSGNKLINDDSLSTYIVKNNINHGSPQYLDYETTHNIYGNYKQITLNKNTWYKPNIQQTYILAVTVTSTSPTNNDTLTIVISKNESDNLGFGICTINKTYTPLHVVIPAGYSVKLISSDDTTFIQHAFVVNI